MKISSNAQRFSTVHHPPPEANFSFAQPRSKSANGCYVPMAVNQTERRAMRMWVETVLEWHSEQFVHALRHRGVFSFGYLLRYMGQYYGHLKMVVRYYILSALIDYQCISFQDKDQDALRECAFSNIVIQELVNRFFRESQWLHKFSHLPIYVVFPLFDRFAKGYTTAEQLRQGVRQGDSGVRKKLKIRGRMMDGGREKDLQQLLHTKLTNNLGWSDSKIYQQNLEELMLRGNLISFQELVKSGGQQGSFRYVYVHKMISQLDELQTKRQSLRVQEQMAKQMREKEEIELMRENLSIKYKSNIMSKTTASNQGQKRDDLFVNTQRKTQYKEHFYSDHLARTQFEGQLTREGHYSNQIYGDKDLNLKNNQFQKEYRVQLSVAKDNQRQKWESSRMKENCERMQNVIHEQIVGENICQIAKNLKSIEYREQVFRQLQKIRLQKRENHCKLLRYI